MIEAVICDIDGTLAAYDLKIRTPYQHDKANTDLPRQNIISLLHIVKSKVDIILVTGRMEQHRDMTEEWLKKYNIPYNLLLMRKDKDIRNDAIIKKEIYETCIKDEYRILFVLDDRNRVVDMWRKELGLDCLQVNYGNF